MAEQIARRGGSPKACHADKQAVGADKPVPAVADAGFNGDFVGVLAEHLALIGHQLALKQFPTRHGDHARRDAGFGQLYLRFNGDRNFRAGGDKRDRPLTRARRR